MILYEENNRLFKQKTNKLNNNNNLNILKKAINDNKIIQIELKLDK